MAESVAIAIMAKAPLPGLVKTRLIPVLGAEGAAALALRLIERTSKIASEAAVGPVTLWCAPDESHPLFLALKRSLGIALGRQSEGDLGDRMHAAVVAAGGPVLVIGTDCPALTARHLQTAATALSHHDAVAIPAEDGGYPLIGLRRPERSLFAAMPWGDATVMQETRRRLRARGLSWHELAPLWDIDTAADLDRLRRDPSLAPLLPSDDRSLPPTQTKP